MIHASFAVQDEPRPLGLIDDATADRLGFTAAEIEAAMTRFAGDPLSWKAILLTSQFEFGNLDPFSTAVPGLVRPDVEFGIGSWSLERNTLQPVLGAMRAADPRAFDRIMGDQAAFVARLIAMRGAEAGEAGAAAMTESRRVTEAWKSRFRALGAVPAFQRIQFDALQPWVVRARRIAADLGLHSERGFAFVFDTIWNRGTSPFASARTEILLARFRAATGRSPDEQELMLLLANAANSRGPAMNLPQVRARILTLALGQGRIYGRELDLADAGLTLREVTTGAPVPLSGDAAILERLRGGWLPPIQPVEGTPQ